MAMMKLEHVGIMVSNLERSIAFYTDVLGMELLGTLDHNTPGIRLAFLSYPGQNAQIELIEGYAERLPDEGQVHHVAITVDDIEAEAARLRGAGVRFLDEAITTLRNGAQYIFFAGPDGERLELFQPPRG
ncbi:VOC family protein [Alicyclobacillus sendaiensis]|uniref:VOC family protein n=1 Tax=Alicyclobacillus sendaiensis PA2 TaxID=3029425 RepID=A0ABT6XVJ1_ALISE|nr:VOC family protein [Alicyclobacillus sendaiensis]MDI9259101.1 VOC family protein [Alicyclobacillus sendaiensis PA2]